MDQEKYTFAGFTFPRAIYQPIVGMKAGKQTHNKALLAKRRELRKVCPSGYIIDPGTNPSEYYSFYLDSDFSLDLRIRYCDEINHSIRHTGWYCDEFGDTNIRGIVARLPHGRGFLAGWSMGQQMISTLDRSTIYDDEMEASRAADDMAERAAENQREFEESENERIRNEEQNESESDDAA